MNHNPGRFVPARCTVRFRLALLLSCAGLFYAEATAWPIVIETTAPKKTVAGFLVSEDTKQIVVRVKLPGGDEEVKKFERSKIKILFRVDRQRLEKLTKENPEGYRDYAEELMNDPRAKGDPEATEVALRLLLIAAYLDTPRLGRSCLLNMSELAARTHPADARKYRALAFLLDPTSDPSLLKVEGSATTAAAAPKSKAERAKLDYFRKALRQYRSGQFKEAQANAEVEGVAPYFSAAPGMMDQKSFVQACKDAATSKDNREDHLDVILRAEAWAIDQILPPEPAKQGAARGWSRALGSQDLTPVPRWSLETITEFDPRQCVFRNGEWVAP
jgi:hypothetical protein